jgi:L-ornithine N5-oxygenase
MAVLDASALDLLGIGFGPANIALAIALDEHSLLDRTFFLERQSEVGWHPGMMLDGAGVQNSFLKDLVTLRNPSSRFSFLAYLKEKGRLHRFINLAQMHTSRWEFNDYFRWVAGHFADRVGYGCEAVELAPDFGADGIARTVTVTTVDKAGDRRSHVTRNVVLGIGGRPRTLPGIVTPSPRVVHSSQFLDRFPDILSNRPAPAAVAVVGGGQSGAELTYHLARELPRTQVHWLVSESAPRPADDTPYINDIFMESEVDRHFDAQWRGETDFHFTLRNSNYGVVDVDLLHSLYRFQYQEAARGQERLHIHTRSRLLDASEENERLLLKIAGPVAELRADLLVLATGYDRDLPPEMAGALLPLLERDGEGHLIVERGYRVMTQPRLAAGIYLQGMAEHSHGLGDTLLPVMPFRAEHIARQVAAGRHADMAEGPARLRAREPDLTA